MFGKGGGPLNTWIREFCELVFIQTLQAFIFAIVIGFILSLQTADLESSDRNAAYGIICIAAFTSIFKIEEILRRIFGYGPTKGDHGNAIQSIGKTMNALRMGRHLLDNGRKIIGGATKTFGHNKQLEKAKNRRDDKLAALDADNMGDGNNSSNTGENKGANTNTQNKDAVAEKNRLLKLAEAKRREALNKRNRAQEIRDGKNVKKLSSKQRKDLPHELEQQAATAEVDAIKLEKKANNINIDGVANNGNTSSSSNNSGGGRIKDYNQRRQKILDEYNDKVAEIDKNRREGIKQMASGFLEAGAAIVGGSAGFAMSWASTNDVGSAIKDGVTWAGTSDAITEKVVDYAADGAGFLNNRRKDAVKLVEGYRESLQSEYENSINEVNDQIQRENEQIMKDVQHEINDINKSMGEAAKRASNSFSSSSAGSSRIRSTGGSHRVTGNYGNSSSSGGLRNHHYNNTSGSRMTSLGGPGMTSSGGTRISSSISSNVKSRGRVPYTSKVIDNANQIVDMQRATGRAADTERNINC